MLITNILFSCFSCQGGCRFPIVFEWSLWFWRKKRKLCFQRSNQEFLESVPNSIWMISVFLEEKRKLCFQRSNKEFLESVPVGKSIILNVMEIWNNRNIIINCRWKEISYHLSTWEKRNRVPFLLGESFEKEFQRICVLEVDSYKKGKLN